jgi:DNA invertase Pin-like site-specific DNA recombinase
MRKRAALFVRAARDPAYGSSAQLGACRAYARQMGYDVVAELVEDGAQPAGLRPALDGLRCLAHAGHLDAVICYTFERLVRSRSDLQLVKDEIVRRGVAVECVEWEMRLA